MNPNALLPGPSSKFSALGLVAARLLLLVMYSGRAAQGESALEVIVEEQRAAIGRPAGGESDLRVRGHMRVTASRV